MNNFERLLMVIVPCVGLSAILYFFTFYFPDAKSGHLSNASRLQGELQERNISNKTSIYKTNNREIVNQKKAVASDYIKWQSEESISYMPQSLKNKVYKRPLQQDSYTRPMSNNSQNEASNNAKLIYQNRLHARQIEQQQKKMKQQECSYYEHMKDKIRERMRRGYKASQYNWLKNQKRHWAKLYSDNCFSGYQYPR